MHKATEGRSPKTDRLRQLTDQSRAGFMRNSETLYNRFENPLPYKREVVGSRAFNLEYFSYSKDAEIRDDIISYLGEYRLKVKKFNYSLIFIRGEDGRYNMADPHRLEPMKVKAQRAILEKKMRGESTRREEAEYDGIGNLEDKITTSQIGDMILWSSPPAPKEEGYGNYGFIYSGEITDLNSLQIRVEMSAIRVEQPTIEQFNKFKEMTGLGLSKFEKAEDFIRNPFVISSESGSPLLDVILKKCFSFNEDSQKEKKVFNKIMMKLDPLISDLIRIINRGKKQEKIDAFYALENYALELKNRYEREEDEKVIYIDDIKPRKLQYMIADYGYKPPVAHGSCSSTQEVKSNNIFSISSSIRHDKYGSRVFTCPSCGQINIRPEDELLSQCQHCGSKDVACEETTANAA